VSFLPLASGKIPVGLLAELLAGLPPAPPELRLGPGVGEDACAIEVGSEALVVASDPVTLTADEVGFLSVVVNANDVAVTGARPRWFLATVLVPPGTSGEDVRGIFADIRRGLERVGAHLVGGHIEVTAAVSQRVVAGQMLGIAEGGRVVATGGAGVGDVVVQVGRAPVEGAAALAREAAAQLEELEPTVLAAARAAADRPGISIVEPALLAARLGATALHDPTEGGLAAGLHELAHASGVRVRVEREAVLWFEPGIAVCRAVDADPWATLASGTLLATLPAPRVDDALRALAAAGHEAAVIGRAEAGSGLCDSRGREIAWPERDEVARLLASRLTPRLAVGDAGEIDGRAEHEHERPGDG
jgi:hydrogenase expression/formation protein HypE